MTATPYQGQPVLYTLNAQDADQINSRRADLNSAGNRAVEGDVCPALIVKLWNPTYANLTVLLDGPDTFWATSRGLGAPGQVYTWYVHDDTAPAPAPTAAPEGQ